MFCRTRSEVETLAQTLNGRGFRAEALHGGMSQKDRDRVMGRFRQGAAELLLATDVAARGLDIGRLSHVINYDVPPAPESYVHRIGRTGRAGREGVAITLAEPRERPLLRNIEKLTGRRLDLGTVPSVADLRARRLEATRASLREAILAGGTEGVREIVQSLAQEFDVVDVAAAAVKLIHEAGERTEAPRAATPPAPSAQTKTAPAPSGPFTRIYVSIGQAAGAEAGDLVGAITGEAKVDGSAIGAVEIEERYSLIDVREDRADEVLRALRGATIRGRPVTVSRYEADKTKRKKSRKKP